jgi:hypothetical protein
MVTRPDWLPYFRQTADIEFICTALGSAQHQTAQIYTHIWATFPPVYTLDNTIDSTRHYDSRPGEVMAVATAQVAAAAGVPTCIPIPYELVITALAY